MKSTSGRHKKALKMRMDGKTYKEIGIALSVSVCRAREIVKKEERRITKPRDWTTGLSTRTINALKNSGITSEDEAIKFLLSGNALEAQNFGKVSYAEAMEHFKIDIPTVEKSAEQKDIFLKVAESRKLNDGQRELILSLLRNHYGSPGGK